MKAKAYQAQGQEQKTQQARKQLRAKIRQERRQLSQSQQEHFAQQATANMLELLARHKNAGNGAEHIALYLTHDGELDTQPLITSLWEQGVNLYLPRVHPFSAGNLLFFAYNPQTPMQLNQYGIAEPKLDIRHLILPEQLDVIITPLVAFDLSGNRMGMGGGYYDRTLGALQNQPAPTAVGFAHDCQQVPQLDRAHWDIPLAHIVTPSKLYAF